MESSARRSSSCLHHAIATGDITAVQELLKQGVHADSRLHIDDEILETASRKSLTSLSSYKSPPSVMDTSSVRESILEETKDHDDALNNSQVRTEENHTKDKDDNENSVNEIEIKTDENIDFNLEGLHGAENDREINIEDDQNFLDEILKKCQEDVDEMHMNSTVIEVTDVNGKTNENPDNLSDKIENDEIGGIDYITFSHGQSEQIEHDTAEPKPENNNLEGTITAPEDKVDRSSIVEDTPKSELQDKDKKPEREDDYLEPEFLKSESQAVVLRDELPATEDDCKRKSLADTIDERLNDENETLIERAASIRVKELTYDTPVEEITSSSVNVEEKPLKLIPRIKRKLSLKRTKKPPRKIEEEEEDDEFSYENQIRPRNVDDEQLNENFEGVAFFEAVREGMDMIVQTLLETSNNYQLNMLDENGFTPIMQAAWHGQKECLAILLDHGAQTKLQNATGCTATHFAAGQGHADCLDLLISYDRLVVDAKTKYGATPLLLAAKGGHTECLELLLNAGADPNIQYRGNQNALLFAAGNGHYDCIKELLKYNVNIDQPNSQNVTPLMRAVQQGHNGCVNILIENGANMNIQDAIGRTAIHFAVEHNNPKGLKSLLDGGASVELKTKGGSKPLDYAERFQNARCAEMLENHLKKLKEEKEKEKEKDRDLEVTIPVQIQKEKPKKKNVSCLSFKHLFRRRKSKKTV